MKFISIVDIHNGKDWLFRYENGPSFYVEYLADGMLWSFGFNKSEPNARMVGFTKFPDREETSVFVVEMDGVTLIDHWEYVDAVQTEEDGCLTVRV